MISPHLLSLKNSTLLAITLALGTLALLLFVAIEYQFQQHLHTEFAHQLQQLAKRFASDQHAHIERDNRPQMEQALKQTVQDKQLHAGSVIYPDGTQSRVDRTPSGELLISRSNPTNTPLDSGKMIIQNQGNQRIGTVVVPIALADAQQAYVQISSHFDGQLGGLINVRNRVMWCGALGIVLAGIMGFFWLSHRTIRPIKELTQFAREASENSAAAQPAQPHSFREVSGLVSALLDMRDKIEQRAHDSNAAIKRENMALSKAQHIAQLGYWEWHPHTGRIKMNQIACQTMGFSAESDISNDISLDAFTQRMSPDHRQAFTQVLHGTANLEHKQLVTSLIESNGQTRYLEFHFQSPDGSDDTDHIACYGTVRDVTEKIRQQKEVQALAYVDSLTGLPNRSCFTECVRRIELLKSNRDYVAVIFLDIDKFKTINDKYGHKTGDEVIRRVGVHAQSLIAREPFTLMEIDSADSAISQANNLALLSRYGGDEYVGILRCNTREAIDDCLQQLDTMAHNFSIEIEEGAELELTLSIGVSIRQDWDLPVQSIIHQSSIALHFAKLDKNHASRAMVFDNQMQTEMDLILEEEEFIRNTISSRSLQVNYQPIVNSQNFSLHSVEALTRIDVESAKQDINVRTFFDQAERLGMIGHVDDWLLVSICKDIQLRAQVLKQSFPTAVNISPIQINTPKFSDSVFRCLDQFNIDPSMLQIEITENMHLENSRVVNQNLKQLREGGIKVFVDDFGTGYSSLESLLRVEIDGIKIDRSLVNMVTENSLGNRLIEIAIELGKAMDVVIVAEGVETQTQRLKLCDLGVDTLQGYLICEPLPQHQLLNLLQGGDYLDEQTDTRISLNRPGGYEWAGAEIACTVANVCPKPGNCISCLAGKEKTDNCPWHN